MPLLWDFVLEILIEISINIKLIEDVEGRDLRCAWLVIIGWLIPLALVSLKYQKQAARNIEESNF